MAKKVAEVFIETLVNADVKRVYGVVGDSLNGLTEVIRKSPAIEWLHVRHEEVAAFAAGAEAHITGELAVCGQLRARQSSPHQRALRLSAQSSPSSRNRSADSQR
jgi:glyoxylate carboligase